MAVERQIAPDPEVATITDADLRAWWEREFRDVVSVGVEPEKLADAMFAVASGRLAGAMGPRRLARVLYMLALKCSADADRIDGATAAATGRRTAH